MPGQGGITVYWSSLCLQMLLHVKAFNAARKQLKEFKVRPINFTILVLLLSLKG